MLYINIWLFANPEVLMTTSAKSLLLTAKILAFHDPLVVAVVTLSQYNTGAFVTDVVRGAVPSLMATSVQVAIELAADTVVGIHCPPEVVEYDKT